LRRFDPSPFFSSNPDLPMPTPDKTAPKKPRESEEDKDEATTLALCDLAMTLALDEARGGAADQESIDFHKIIKRSLHQKKDEVLYDALARAETLDHRAAIFLKAALEEAAEVTVIERADGRRMEINAFVIPLFLHTAGGLDPDRCFQDQDAFEQLSKSFQAGALESPAANVVLVNHGYHLNEIDGITYSHLHEMLRDAFGAMTDKRIAATPAIDRSFGGWPDNPFSADDAAIELRFLLGFSLKAVDDPFYEVPDSDDAADAYFEARETRFQKWTATAAPLVRRCFGLGGEAGGAQEADVHFLYQDLFHGGKERGIAEYFMLQMISELNQGLQVKGVEGSAARAVMGPVDAGGEAVLRVRLEAIHGGALLAQADKPVPGIADWDMEFADSHGALTMIGVTSVSVARQFDRDGAPVDVSPYDGPSDSA
jgi:hypothetical protein